MLLIAFILLHIRICLGQNVEQSSDYNYDDTTFSYCTNLELSVGDFFTNRSLCCDVPDAEVPPEINEYCLKECNLNQPNILDCCYYICILKEVRFLKFSTDPNIRPVPDVEGYIRLLMQSVDNDPVWEPVIRSSSSRCFYDADGTDNDFICQVVPSTIIYMSQCNFKENFLKCPYWNPYKIEKCQALYELVENCLASAFIQDTPEKMIEDF